MVYFIVALFLLYLTIHYDINGYKKNKQMWYNIVLVFFILFMGFRYRIGLDTIRYMREFFEDVPLLSEISMNSFSKTRTEPFYLLFLSITKTFFGKFYVVQIIQSLTVNTLLFHYFKKHTPYLFTCILLYYLWRYFSFTTEEMRASIAVVICLYANDFALEKKYKKSVLLFLLAGMFHASAFFLVFVPFIISFLHFNLKGHLTIAFMAFFGLFLQTTLGEYIDMITFTSQLEHKSVELQRSVNSSQVLNIVGILALLILYYVYPVFSVSFLKRKKDVSLIKYEPYLVVGCIMAMLSIGVNIFYRYVHFYEIYVIMFVATAAVNICSSRLSPNNNINNLILFVPFLFLVSYSYFQPIHKGSQYKTYMRIYPYNSIFDMEMDYDRESLFLSYGVLYYEAGKN